MAVLLTLVFNRRAESGQGAAEAHAEVPERSVGESSWISMGRAEAESEGALPT